jgi:EAL domain-containing protein (putative c-di-GMP-specific phosphodiesterase class I)
MKRETRGPGGGPYAAYALAYQPQVRLDPGTRHLETTGAEALLRPPGDTDPLALVREAEASGEIAALGNWVLRTACAAHRAAGDGADRRTVSVNVSAAQIARADFAATVAGALTDTGLAPAALVLEISERLLFREQEAPEALAQLVSLRERGVGLVLDNFGTGYAALSLLRRLPLTGIKIAPAFIRRIATASADRSVVRVLTELCASMGLTIRAMGVETAARRSALLRLGCWDQQGFLFGRPLPVLAWPPPLTFRR